MGTKDHVPVFDLSKKRHHEGNCNSRKKAAAGSAKGQRKHNGKERVTANNKNVLPVSSKGYFREGITDTVENAALDRLVKIELDAAQALAEFSRIVHLPATNDTPCDAGAPHLQWFGKRKRSSRIFSEPKSLEENDHVSLIKGRKLMPSNAAHINKDSSLDDCSKWDESFVMKAIKAGISKALTVDEEERRSLTESSKESISADSRAESPSSPLSPLQLDCRAFPVGGTATSSAFQRVVPRHSVQKPSSNFVKSEVEDINCEVTTYINTQPAKFTVKRKVQPSKPLLQTVSVKVEETFDGSPSTIMLQPNSYNRCQVEVDARCSNQAGPVEAESAAEAAMVSSSPPVKAERRLVGNLVNKPKAAVTDMEKEARRLRRIQANRESARQTIRRKQALCEQLTQKAASLTTENEKMKKKREELLQELCTLSNRNRHLKEQLVHSGSELGSDTAVELTPISSLPFKLPTVRVPMAAYGGMHVQSYFWAFALAQAAAATQAMGLQTCEAAPSMNHNLLSYANNVTSGMARCIGQEELESQTAVSNLQEPQLESESGSNSSSAYQAQAFQGAYLPPSTSPLVTASLHSHTNKVQMLAGGIPVGGVSQACVTSGHSGFSLESTKFGKAGSSHGSTPILSGATGSIMGPPQSYVFTGRKVSVTMAAAEARRRRKELTRSKILQSRPFKSQC